MMELACDERGFKRQLVINLFLGHFVLFVMKE